MHAPPSSALGDLTSFDIRAALLPVRLLELNDWVKYPATFVIQLMTLRGNAASEGFLLLRERGEIGITSNSKLGFFGSSPDGPAKAIAKPSKTMGLWWGWSPSRGTETAEITVRFGGVPPFLLYAERSSRWIVNPLPSSIK